MMPLIPRYLMHRHPLFLHKLSLIPPHNSRPSTMAGFKTLCAAVLLLLAVGSHTGKKEGH